MTTNKRCTKCGVEYPATPEYFHRKQSSKDGLRSHCKHCGCMEARRWQVENPEKKREKDRRWRAANPDKARAGSRRYWAKYPEKSRERRRQWKAEHPERVRETKRRWSAANREKERERVRLWAKSNTDKLREYRTTHREEHRVRQLSRRARKRAAEGTHTVADVQAQLKRQRGKCYYCGCKLDKYHVDHVVPLDRGGRNSPDNLVIACPICNLSKHNKLPHEWAKGGRLL